MLLILFILIPITVIQLAILYKMQSAGKASLFLTLHEKLNDDEMFARMINILDREVDSELINGDTLDNADFINYVDFLDSFISVGGIRSFSKRELETLFGTHSELLKRHQVVRNYVVENNYSRLAEALDIKK